MVLHTKTITHERRRYTILLSYPRSHGSLDTTSDPTVLTKETAPMWLEYFLVLDDTIPADFKVATSAVWSQHATMDVASAWKFSMIEPFEQSLHGKQI